MSQRFANGVFLAQNKSIFEVVMIASSGYSASVNITRPADTTAYTAGDVVGAATAALSFANIGPTAVGQILITSVQLEIDVTAVPSGMTSFRLHLYNVTPPSAYADNAVWDLASGDRASYLGYVDLGSPVDLGSTLYVRNDGVNAQFTPLSTSIFGYLVTNGAFTPAASTVMKITLHSAAL